MLDVSAPPRQHLDALKRGHYIKLPTYIADFRGFIKYANDLKTNVFKFHKKWQSIARKLFDMMITSAKNNSKGSQVQEKPFITVSIHIRLTDFGQHLQRFWNVSLATQDYFTSAMQYFEDKYEVRNMVVIRYCYNIEFSITLNFSNNNLRNSFSERFILCNQ